MSAIADALRAEMLGYDTCLLSDALERLHLPHGISGIRPLAAGRRIFGPAVTVKLESFRGDLSKENLAKQHLGTSAIAAAMPGDIIVVEHHARSDCAGWGGLLSLAAKARGLGGVIVDGLARDVDECVDMDFPLFARGATPITARGRVMETATNGLVMIGAVPLRPHDFVLADANGVVILPQDRIDDIVGEARRLHNFENSIRAAVAAGTPIGEAMNESYETALKTQG
jgi:regulator of RNase E activity RraA